MNYHSLMIFSLSHYRRHTRLFSLAFMLLFSSSVLATSLVPCEMNFSQQDMSSMNMEPSANSPHDCCDTSNNTDTSLNDCSMSMMQIAKITLNQAVLVHHQYSVKTPLYSPNSSSLLNAHVSSLLRPPIV